MPEWLIERGIGETRACWSRTAGSSRRGSCLDGAVPAGTVIAARLTSVGINGRNAIARGDDGSEYLLPKSPRGITEGAAITIEITREAIPGNEGWKRPLARVSEAVPSPAPALEGTVVPFPSPGSDPSRCGGLVRLARGSGERDR